MVGEMKFTLKLRKGILRKYLRALVAIFHATAFRNRRLPSLENMPAPRRILILNGAHIGDMVVSTSILPVLRSAFPSAEIGFLVGGWASMVIKNHPDIQYIHRVDHWWHNRSTASRWKKYIQYRKTYKTALAEVRARNYDLALCIYPYLLPDFMDLAWKAKIPVRVGFKVSVYSPLATTTVEVPRSPFLHQAAIQAAILTPLKLAATHLEKREPVLPGSTPEAVSEVCKLLNVEDLANVRYRIIHVGTGARNREMSLEFWKELASTLCRQHIILFTGQGEREARLISEIMSGLENCFDACNKLSWAGFVAAVRHADVLYGLESMAGHVAGAVGTRSIVVYSGMAGVARWRPEGPTIVMTNHLECAPCNLPSGCQEMTCLRGVKAEDLVNFG
jgi:ADP-heptose:LPS heptosyltransferase